jgi:uncharacterized protein YsxB (DUF464 family)
MGDPLRDVIHHIREMEHWRAIGADDDEILHIGRLLFQVTFDFVMKGHIGAGHSEDNAFALAGAALVLFVGVAGLEEFFGRQPVLFMLGRLVEGGFVKVQAQPLHGLQDGFYSLGRRPLAIGILKAEEKLPPMMTRKQPVENGGSDIADVDLSSRAGRKTNSNTHVKIPLYTLKNPG